MDGDSNTYLRDLGLYDIKSRVKYNQQLSAFHEDTQKLLYSDDNKFKLIDINTFDIREIAYSDSNYSPKHIVFHKNGKSIFCVLEGGKVILIDLKTAKYEIIYSMDKYERSAISEVLFRIYYYPALIFIKNHYGKNKELHFLNIDSGEINEKWLLDFDGKIAISQDCSYLAGCDDKNKLIHIYDFKSRKLFRIIETNLAIKTLKFSVNNEFILCASRERIYSYTLSTGLRNQICSIYRTFTSDIDDFFLCANNHTLLVYDAQVFESRIYYFDFKKGKEREHIGCHQADFLHLDEVNQVLITTNAKGFNPIQYKTASLKPAYWGIVLLLVELKAKSDPDFLLSSLNFDIRSLIYDYCFRLENIEKSECYKNFPKFSFFKPQVNELARSQTLFLDLNLDNNLSCQEHYKQIMDSLSYSIKPKRFGFDLKQAAQFQLRLASLAHQFESIKADQSDIPAYKVASMIHLLVLFKDELEAIPVKDKLKDYEKKNLITRFDSLISDYCNKSDLDLRKIKTVPVELTKDLQPGYSLF